MDANHEHYFLRKYEWRIPMNNEVGNTVPEKWVNLEDVATHLSVSHDTIRAWIRKCTIPFSRAGKQYKFKLSEVDEWVREGKISE